MPEFIVSVPSVTVKETQFKAAILYNHIGITTSMVKKTKTPTPADRPPKTAITKEITNNTSNNCASTNHFSLDGTFKTAFNGMVAA